ncbi:hypothetical protein AK812_SmicGene46226 [Symbiodinium microadriaticum]|uniref:Uncharacterized protein n=1 Tax=Symbiodinium microadriaticum TaxID=2951 RepID=A0A1Q9BUB8_SYMMI|nr:hypothetical protein AK812_SmicGene46226 [Symbiodinium microadriaticum]
MLDADRPQAQTAYATVWMTGRGVGQYGKVMVAASDSPRVCSLQHYDADQKKAGVQSHKNQSVSPLKVPSLFGGETYESEWSGYTHIDQVSWGDWWRINWFAGKHLDGIGYDGMSLKHERLALRSIDDSALPFDDRVALKLAWVDQPSGTMEVQFQSVLQPPEYLPCMNNLSSWSHTCLSAGTGGLAVSQPREPCGLLPHSRWQTQPRLRLQEFETHAVPNASSRSFTCLERQMLGPQDTPLGLFRLSWMVFVPISFAWYACYPNFAFTATNWCTLYCCCPWGYIDNCIPCPCCWCFPWFFWAIGGLVLMALLTFGIALIDLVWYLVNGMAAVCLLPLMPMLEQNHWHNMDRAILICVDDVAFTFAATPFYLSYILYNIYELTANWKGWRDAQEEQSILCGIFRPSVGTLWTYTQAVDAFTDLAALLGYCMHYPAWFSSLWAVTTFNSWAIMLGVASKKISYSRGLLASLLAEDIFQCGLVLTSCLAFSILKKDVSEFMVYSAALSVLSVVKSGMLLLSREFSCQEAMYSAAGANIFETTAMVGFVQLGTPPDWVLAQPDNAGGGADQYQFQYPVPLC